VRNIDPKDDSAQFMMASDHDPGKFSKMEGSTIEEFSPLRAPHLIIE